MSVTQVRSSLSLAGVTLFAPAAMVSALVFSFAVLPPTVQAAPHPTASVIAPKSGVYRSPLGFEMNTARSGWQMESAPAGSRYVATMFRPRNNNTAALTVRVDKLERPLSIDQYVQRWKKEYPRFGFDVLGAKPFTQNNRRGYVVDLINRENKRQLRQVLFVSPKRTEAVIMTCRDQIDRFKGSLAACNQIVRTFNWKQ